MAAIFDPTPITTLIEEFGDAIADELVRDGLRDIRARVATLQVHASNGDLAGIGKVGHSLKSLAGSFGLSGLQSLARGLEEAGRQGDLPAALSGVGLLSDLLARSEAALTAALPRFAIAPMAQDRDNVGEIP